MPKFILDKGSPETARAFAKLDSFTQAYIEALFFTEETPGTTTETWNPESDSAFPGDMTFADLAESALAKIVADCTVFQSVNRVALACAYTLTADGTAYTEERAGHDFWLTRNGHGAGFWDRSFRHENGDSNESIGERLSNACKHFGECTAYLGDDGKIYISG